LLSAEEMLIEGIRSLESRREERCCGDDGGGNSPAIVVGESAVDVPTSTSPANWVAVGCGRSFAISLSFDRLRLDKVRRKDCIIRNESF